MAAVGLIKLLGMKSSTYPLLAASDPTRIAAMPLRPTANTFHDLLMQHNDALLRWVLARVGQPKDQDDPARRAFVEAAAEMQRRRGEPDFSAWLYAAAVRVARRLSGGDGTPQFLPEAALAGLLPEMRSVLRLVARGGIGVDEANLLLPMPLEMVRRRLVHTRQSTHSAAMRGNSGRLSD